MAGCNLLRVVETVNIEREGVKKVVVIRQVVKAKLCLWWRWE
ncbi:hypothetical protein COLO4_12340 [Corchorus olitorius]|uniref:Uncharacterized protein n=1 Tax=Corchorus olitorius TaxID=93759 RepID=A0A1R3K1H0_9ROSI|nr:hypothetical protein COLO4_12340 [Corchorus olitorius]